MKNKVLVFALQSESFLWDYSRPCSFGDWKFWMVFQIYVLLLLSSVISANMKLHSFNYDIQVDSSWSVTMILYCSYLFTLLFVGTP